MHNFSLRFPFITELTESKFKFGAVSHALQRGGMETNKNDTPTEINRLDIREQYLTLYCALHSHALTKLVLIIKFMYQLLM
jgi:hypothetical protein